MSVDQNEWLPTAEGLQDDKYMTLQQANQS
jgi:hypothetical protein